MYGFRVVGAESGLQIRKARIGAGEIIAEHDPVTIKTDGEVYVADAGDVIDGVALEAAIDGGDIHYKGGNRLLVLADNDNDGTTFAVTHEGSRCDMIGTTGAVLVDTSSVAQVGNGADTGQLLCRKFNPQGYGFDDDTSIGLYEVRERL